MAVDVSKLNLIGEGRHGAVFRLDEKRCIKVYRKREYLEQEYNVLKHSQGFPFFPKVYECKENFMIREYFDGPNLREYVLQNGFSESLAVKLLEIIDAFIELDYSRIDCRLPHIIVTQGEKLKIIDPTRNMSKKLSYPRLLLRELGRLGYKEQFIAYTKLHRPQYYASWKDVWN